MSLKKYADKLAYFYGIESSNTLHHVFVDVHGKEHPLTKEYIGDVFGLKNMEAYNNLLGYTPIYRATLRPIDNRVMPSFEKEQLNSSFVAALINDTTNKAA